MSVYFLATEDQRFVKIGTSRSHLARIKDLQRLCPLPLQLIKLLPGHVETERVYHWYFSQNRIHGEWFRANPEMLKWITDLDDNGFVNGDVDA